MSLDLDNLDGADEATSKKSSLLITIGVVVILSAVAIGIGFFLGNVIRNDNVSVSESEGSVEADSKNSTEQGHNEGDAGKSEEVGSHGATGASSTVILEPIIVTLPKSNNTWVRLELAAIVSDGKPSPDPALQTRILGEISGYLRTTDMEQLYGPSGYLHLQDDLLDIARRQTNGVIDEILILSLVSE